jgi:hypothetical protein
VDQIGATKLTFLGKVKRVLEPRERRNQRLATNAATLVERMTALGVEQSVLDRARGKLRHEQARLALPIGRIRRIGPVLREVASGRYGSFGRGAPDILRDLVQPAS